MAPEEHPADVGDLGLAPELDGTLLHLPERPELEALPGDVCGPEQPPAPAPALLAAALRPGAGLAAAAEAGGFGGAAEEAGEAQLAASCEPPLVAELPPPPEAWRPCSAVGLRSDGCEGNGSVADASAGVAPADAPWTDEALAGSQARQQHSAPAEVPAAPCFDELAEEVVPDACGLSEPAGEGHGAVAAVAEAAAEAADGSREGFAQELEGNGEVSFEAKPDAPTPRCLDLSAEDLGAAGESCADSGLELRRERAALLHEVCKLKAKFELTLETLRSILRLGVEATWADIMERCEALAQSGGGTDSACSTPLRLAATDADLERERLEENLEAQAAYNVRLRELLQKQQVLLDMTTQLPQKNNSDADVRAECDMLLEKLQEQQGQMSRQDATARQQAEQLAALQTELGEERRTAAAERKRREAEDARLRTDSERKRAEVRELVDALASRDDLVERLRGQLQGHEAAALRKRSYHPSRSNSNVGVGEDATSDFNSSVGSARTSARGPSTRAGSEQDGPAAAPRPIEDMGRDERDAFLSHFPMSSRTERQMRNRLDDRRRRPGLGT